MQQRRLGEFQVGRIGLGCMNLDHGYALPVSEEQGERVLLQALEAGFSRAFNTIFDSNATGFLSHVMLFAFGAGPVIRATSAA